MDLRKGEAVKVIPIDGCYLHVRYERLLGDKRKTANAFRTGWVTNTSTVHPTTCGNIAGTVMQRPVIVGQQESLRCIGRRGRYRPRP
jgi:hypothetical protein